MDKVWTFKFIFLILLIIGIVLFSLAFSTVPINNSGILQQIYSKNVTQYSVYSPGIYFIGIQNKFLTYSNSIQTLVFSNDNTTTNLNQQTEVISSTLDGSQISFSAIIYYTYIPELLYSLYTQYPTVDHHTQVLAQEAKTIMISIMNKYSYNDFLTNRIQISLQMSYNISQTFLTDFYTSFKFLLITNIVLEQSHEQNLINTFLAQQGQISSQANNTINTIQAQINLLKAQTNNLIASSVQNAGILGAAQQGSYLLQSEQLKVSLTSNSLLQLKNIFQNDSAYIKCLQMMNIYLNDNQTITWNSDFIK